jgi:copper chaperone CopZ
MKTTLYIQNLKCSGCETTIINKLSALKGILNIFIKLQYDSVTFEHETNDTVDKAKKILSRIGYPSFSNKNSLEKKAKSFVS